MYEYEQAIIAEFMERNGNINNKKAIEKGNIAILAAKDHYGRYASDNELEPFDKATTELINIGILAGARSFGSVLAQIYYLELEKLK